MASPITKDCLRTAYRLAGTINSLAEWHERRKYIKVLPLPWNPTFDLNHCRFASVKLIAAVEFDKYKQLSELDRQVASGQYQG